MTKEQEMLVASLKYMLPEEIYNQVLVLLAEEIAQKDKTIYRKLKDYIHTEHDIVTTTKVIFGDLTSTDCEFYYDGKTYRPSGVYYGLMDFLLEYYVVGIRPVYRIVNDRIDVYLRITLRKEVKGDE